MSTWRELIETAMESKNDSFDNVVFSTLSDEELDVDFDAGYGGSNGEQFTLWTKKRVYFPVVYDGLEWASSVPRNPCEEKTKHIGGE